MSRIVERIVLVETTVQVARIVAAPQRKAQINQLLTSATVRYVTTGYVLMEYQRSLAADFVHVHRAFHRARTMGEALRQVFRGRRAFRARSLARCGQIVGLACGHREVVHLNDVKRLLTTYLEATLLQTFDHHVTSLPDSLACDLSIQGPTRLSDGVYTMAETCRKEKAACHLPEFLAGKRAEILVVADYLKAHPAVIKDQPRVTNLIQSILADPRVALGQTACWPLGDLIILLQTPPDVAVWTLDTDFEPLATALDVPLYTPSTSLNSL